MTDRVRSRVRKLRRGFRSGFADLCYTYLFFRHPSAALRSLAIRFEEHDLHRKEDEGPHSTKEWDDDYGSGRWDYLHSLRELPRYSILAGYLNELKPGGSVLDVGCGDGRLFNVYRPYGYSAYVGLELSATALEGLHAEEDERTRFICANGETYVPDQGFDAVVFNESLYYFSDPLEAVERYGRTMNEGGVILISSFAGLDRALAILRALKARFRVIDETKVTNGKLMWICTVFSTTALL